MHTLFVGVNPGVRSAQIGHYFGGKTNFFWRLLHAAEIWPQPLTTLDDDKVVEAGFGFTDTCKRPTPGTDGLKKADFLQCQKDINRIVQTRRPATVVFVSKTAYRAYMGDKDALVSYGLQEGVAIHGAEVFILPSTSAASQKDSNYAGKLKHFRRLKKHLDDRGAKYQPG